MERPPHLEHEEISCSSGSNDFSSLSEERVDRFLEHTELGKSEIDKCNGQPAVLIIGDTGVGKSVFFNFLQGIEMQHIEAQNVGLVSHLFDEVVDIVRPEHGEFNELLNVSMIGHNFTSETEFPKLALIKDMAFCDCPGFHENRGDEISLAHAVNIHRIIHIAQSIRIIVLVDYFTLIDRQTVKLEKVLKMMEKLFGNSQMLKGNLGSIMLGVTKVPRIQEGESASCLTVLSKHLKKIKLPIFNILADTLFVFDPVTDGHNSRLKLYPIMSRDHLLTKISQSTPIFEPIRIFRMALTTRNELILIKTCEYLVQILNTRITSGDWLNAALLFQNFKKLTVLEHKVVSDSMKNVRKNMANVHHEVENSVNEALKKGALKRAEERLNYLGRLLKTFEDPECKDLLEQLVQEYKKVKYWKIVKRNAAISAGVVACTVAIGTGGIFLPFGIAATAGIAVSMGVCGLGTIAGVTKMQVKASKSYEPLETAQSFHTS